MRRGPYEKKIRSNTVIFRFTINFKIHIFRNKYQGAVFLCSEALEFKNYLLLSLKTRNIIKPEANAKRSMFETENLQFETGKLLKSILDYILRLKIGI